MPPDQQRVESQKLHYRDSLVLTIMNVIWVWLVRWDLDGRSEVEAPSSLMLLVFLLPDSVMKDSSPSNPHPPAQGSFNRGLSVQPPAVWVSKHRTWHPLCICGSQLIQELVVVAVNLLMT